MLANIEYTPAVAAATANSFERVRSVIPEIEWPVHAPYVDAISKSSVGKQEGDYYPVNVNVTLRNSDEEI